MLIKRTKYVVVDHEVLVSEAKSGKTALLNRKEAIAVCGHLQKEVKDNKKMNIKVIPFIY